MVDIDSIALVVAVYLISISMYEPLKLVFGATLVEAYAVTSDYQFHEVMLIPKIGIEPFIASWDGCNPIQMQHQVRLEISTVWVSDDRVSMDDNYRIRYYHDKIQ